MSSLLDAITYKTFYLSLDGTGERVGDPHDWTAMENERLPVGLHGRIKMARIIVTDGSAVNLIPWMFDVAPDGEMTELGLEEAEFNHLTSYAMTAEGDSEPELLARQLEENKWRAAKPTPEEFRSLIKVLPWPVDPNFGLKIHLEAHGGTVAGASGAA